MAIFELLSPHNMTSEEVMSEAEWLGNTEYLAVMKAATQQAERAGEVDIENLQNQFIEDTRKIPLHVRHLRMMITQLEDAATEMREQLDQLESEWEESDHLPNFNLSALDTH